MVSCCLDRVILDRELELEIAGVVIVVGIGLGGAFMWSVKVFKNLVKYCFILGSCRVIGG